MPKEPSEIQKLCGCFWEQFVKDLKASELTIGGEKIQSKLTNSPKVRFNYNIRIVNVKGGSIYIGLTFKEHTRKLGTEIWLRDFDYENKFYNELLKQQDAIGKAFGLDLHLEWLESGRDQKPKPKSSIVCEKSFTPLDDPNSNWDEQNEWFKNMIAKFDEVFTTRLYQIARELKIEK